jgi:hypothetical protein
MKVFRKMRNYYFKLVLKPLIILVIFISLGMNIYHSGLQNRIDTFIAKVLLKVRITPRHSDLPSPQLVLSNYYAFNFNQVFPKLENSIYKEDVKSSKAFSGRAITDTMSYSRYGALEMLNGELLFVDGDGHSWLINEKKVTKGPFFAVPNHKSEFLKFIKRESDYYGKFFGIKDVLVRPSLGLTSEIYVSTTDFDSAKQCYFISVFKNYIENRNNLNINRDWIKLFESRPCLPRHAISEYLGQSAGGRLAKDDKGNIFLSTGDFYFDGVNAKSILQSKESDYGKIILLPKGKGKAVVIAKGLRNPQGLFFFKGNLYESEHGPQGGDEVNLINPKNSGINFGWPAATFGVDYGKFEWPLDTKNKNHLLLNFITPIFSWIPSIGVSNLLVINNTTELIRWNENLIVSSLKDQSLYRLLLDKKNSVYLVERVNIGIRIRDLLQIGDLIYLLEDSDTPRIWKLSVKKKPLP